MQVLDKTVSQLTIPTPFAVGDTHIYVIKGDTLTLVDAGVKTKEAWEALQFQLKEIGYHPNDIEQIILTHHHPDHIGLIEQFPRVQELIGHKHVDVWLKRDEMFFQHYKEFYKAYFISCGVPETFYPLLEQLPKLLHFAGEGALTQTIDEGDLLPGHPDWQVIETKGHAQTHLSFYRQHDHIFIGGDHLLHHISPNPIIEPPYEEEMERARPLLQYRRNLTKCLALGIQTVLPGHGIIFSDVEDVIMKRFQKQEARAEKVLQILRGNELTPFQVCQQLFPRKYEKQLDLTLSETIGQLDYLESEGAIQKNVKNGIDFYAQT
ncbi:MBL fold metallo-hydrolase [Oceanobacillus halotolerans]|uniref:MBL fold metallo-hydrolase n=1 Tax=Oceanobacillus halotolerans TaxID=2663380 RepID=UPI0013DC770F|nr:MBL fold metallo-hydrolase [Oceanobacillus halotolerans]